MTETAIWRDADMTRAPFANCHDGEGTVAGKIVADGRSNPGRHLRFMHHDVLPPGTSIGLHPHRDDEEYYYVLRGRGEMTLGEVVHPVGPGDLTAVYPGGRHGLANTGDEDLEILVISVA